MLSDLIPPPIDIPNGWQLVRLRDICSKIGSGATPTGGQAAYLAHRSHFAFVRSQNVYDRRFSSDGLAFISDEQASKLKGVELRENDILLNITGDGITFGRACLIDKRILPACVNQHVSIIRVNPERACPEFVLTFLTHPIIKGYIESFNAGGSRRAITKAHIEAFVLPLPPLELQREIGSTLQFIDDKIAFLRKTNGTLEAISQALFKSWFVDFDPVLAKAEGRDPESVPPKVADFFPSEFEESEMGSIPKGWRVGTLSEIVNQRNERTNPGSRTEALPYVPIECISSKSIFLQESKPGSDAQSSLILFRKGDILFGAMRPYFHKVCIAPDDGVTRSTAFVLVPKTCENRYFALLMMFQSATIEFATTHSEGSTIPYAKWRSSLDSMHVVIPPGRIAKAYGELVEGLIARGLTNVQEINTLCQVRDSLLPRLMSGKFQIEGCAV
jgi:type I restriction enzyme S subunit